MALGQFSLDLSKFVKKAGVNFDLVVKKVIFDIFSDIVKLTPRDTGRAASNWQIGGSLGSGQVGSFDKSGQVAISKGQAAVKALVTKAQVIGYIYNNVEYIGPLEYGHSKQAPRGIVRITLANYQAYINKAAAALK